jgi:cytochrome c oxidase assembly protein subunit 11
MCTRLFRTLTSLSRTQPLLSNSKNIKSPQIRWKSNRDAGDSQKFRINTTLFYVAGGGMLVVGFSYAAVPLYSMFCQAYSYGGTTATHDSKDIGKMNRIENRVIKIKFNADIGASMRWNFKPQQYEIKV